MSTHSRTLAILAALAVGAGAIVIWQLRTDEGTSHQPGGAAQPQSENEAEVAVVPNATEIQTSISPGIDLRRPELPISPPAPEVAPASAPSSVLELRRRIYQEKLPLLDAAQVTLKSPAFIEVMSTNIAVLLDAQGRGTAREVGKSVPIPSQRKTGLYTFTFNGTTYSFDPLEFPEYDYFYKNRRSIQPDFPGMDVVIGLVKQRAATAVQLLH